MDKLYSRFKEFVKKMEDRLKEKEMQGSFEWKNITKENYVYRIIKNLHKEDYAEVANLTMLLWATKQAPSQDEEFKKAFLSYINQLAIEVKTGKLEVEDFKVQDVFQLTTFSGIPSFFPPSDFSMTINCKRVNKKKEKE
jgi:hypothetical protein